MKRLEAIRRKCDRAELLADGRRIPSTAIDLSVDDIRVLVECAELLEYMNVHGGDVRRNYSDEIAAALGRLQ